MTIEFKIGWESLSGHQQHLLARQDFPRNNNMNNNTSDPFSVNRRHATSHIGMLVSINQRLEPTRIVSKENTNNTARYIIMRPSDLLGRNIYMQNDIRIRIMGIEHIDKDDLLRTEFEVQYQENGSDYQSTMTYNAIINGMPPSALHSKWLQPS